MEDRYLFKAKTARIVDSFNNADDGVWVKGYLRCDTGKWEISQFEYDRADYVWYEVDPATICQSTGLKDKRDNLIWENDIVRVIIENGNTVCRCAFDDTVAHFQLWQKHTIKGTPTALDLGNYDCEVIGNIFDNKEFA